MPRISLSTSWSSAITLVLLAALLAVFGRAAETTGAASQGVTYDVSGTATTIPTAPNPNPLCGISDVFGCPIGAQGMVSTASAPPGAPASGIFTLGISQFSTFPPSPCRAKTVSGTLRVSWTDGRTTTATVNGRFHDSKPILYLSGTTDASSTAYPPSPMNSVLVNFPPSPCVAATNAITGTLTFGR